MQYLCAVEAAQDAVTGPHLPHDHAEAVHIGCVRQLPGLEYLGRAVCNGACSRAGECCTQSHGVARFWLLQMMQIPTLVCMRQSSRLDM